MNETILNIYLIINNGLVEAFKAYAYEMEGGDDRKIKFLKEHASLDYGKAYTFDAPKDKSGHLMPYKKFARLEERGRQYELFEEIFSNFNLPERPLICVTPVVDGDIIG